MSVLNGQACKSLHDEESSQRSEQLSTTTRIVKTTLGPESLKCASNRFEFRTRLQGIIFWILLYVLEYYGAVFYRIFSDEEETDCLQNRDFHNVVMKSDAADEVIPEAELDCNEEIMHFLGSTSYSEDSVQSDERVQSKVNAFGLSSLDGAATNSSVLSNFISHGSDTSSTSSENSTASSVDTCLDLFAGPNKFERFANRYRKWIELFHKNGLEYSVMDDILRILDTSIKSWKTVVRNVCKYSGLRESVEKYAICPGHMAFVDEFDNPEVLTSCSYCEKESSDPCQLKSSDSILSYLPILPRVQEMVRGPVRCEQLYSYRRSRVEEEGIVSDYFDSCACGRLTRVYGEESMEFDIFLAASTDGFEAFKNKQYDVWPLVAINFNLLPDQRFLIQNIIPLAFVPGPKEPKDLQSFIQPLLMNSSLSFQQTGLCWSSMMEQNGELGFI